MTTPEHFTVVRAAIFHPDSQPSWPHTRFLYAERSATCKTNASLYEYPGGTLDPDEVPEPLRGLQREVQEELQLDIVVDPSDQPFYIDTYPFTDATGKNKVRTTLFYLAMCTQQEIVPDPKEVAQTIWANPWGIASFPRLTPATRAATAVLLESLPSVRS